MNAWRDYWLSHDSFLANAMDQIATDNLCFPESVPSPFLPCMLFPRVLTSVKSNQMSDSQMTRVTFKRKCKLVEKKKENQMRATNVIKTCSVNKAQDGQ